MAGNLCTRPRLLDTPDARNPTILDVSSKKFGIRKIELIQRPLSDEMGLHSSSKSTTF
jgi:hypothetical protein